MTSVGTVQALWRYPVKSMQGEQIGETVIGERGVLGDRAYAILDRATGHVASAKHPRTWSNLFRCRAAFAYPPQLNAPLPPVAITLPDGAVISSVQPDVDLILARVLGRAVQLTATAPAAPTREADRSPVDDAGAELIRQEPLALAAPAGTFFDHAPIHILTTATLARFKEVYAQGDWDVRRFRPNIVIQTNGDEREFVENHWPAHTLAIGATESYVLDPCPRCVVTTLAHGERPSSPAPHKHCTRLLREMIDYNHEFSPRRRCQVQRLVVPLLAIQDGFATLWACTHVVNASRSS